MLGVGRVVLLLFVVAVVLLIFLVDAVVHFVTESATATEQTSLTFLIAAAESTRSFFPFEFALLSRWWVLATLLSTACRVRKPLVSGCFVRVLLVIDEVPTLREMCAEILDDWAS
jgi:hypothetical protein